MIPITEDELTEFLESKATTLPQRAEARRLARLMLASEQMYEALKGKSDKSYWDYLDQLKRDACLGSEQKLHDGTFTLDNLDAFMRAAEFLGRHKAYAEMRSALAAAEGRK